MCVSKCRLYGQRQALNAQVLHGMQPALFTPAAGDDGATAAAKVTLNTFVPGAVSSQYNLMCQHRHISSPCIGARIH